MDEWTAETESESDIVSLRSAGALHDLLERDCDPPQEDDVLPVLWHWLAFLPRARHGALGGDGHPSTGGFLPPMGGRKRMHAGSRATVAGAVRVGQPLERTSRVADIRHREGSSGPLVVVSVRHHIDGGTGTVIEEADLVYAQPTRYQHRSNTDEAFAADWTRTVPVDPVLLFRFSALTYNAHRIHYDRDYATQAEGYPGLVVQGPLQAMLLADAVRRAVSEAVVTEFNFRAVAPAFDDAPLELALRAGDEPGRLELTASSGGRRTMLAHAVLTQARA